MPITSKKMLFSDKSLKLKNKEEERLKNLKTWRQNSIKLNLKKTNEKKKRLSYKKGKLFNFRLAIKRTLMEADQHSRAFKLK